MTKKSLGFVSNTNFELHEGKG